MKTKMVIKKASMGGTSSGYTPSTAQNSNKVSCDAYSKNGGEIMKKGGAVKKAGLKEVPKNKKGLKKLPTFIRNKMGYAEKGGKVGKC